MLSSTIFSIILWVLGPLLALVGFIVLAVWLREEIQAGYYK